MKVLLALFPCAAAIACSGVTSVGEVGDDPVRVDGTGFAWIDATSYVPEGDGFRLSDRPSDEVILHLAFTEAVFDPDVDLRSLSGAERERIERALLDGDFVQALVRRGDQLLPDDVLTYDSKSSGLPPEASPYLADVKVALGRPPVDRASTYPDEILPLGGGRTAQLRFDQTSPRLAGRLDVQITRSEDEADADAEVRRGAFSVIFDVELLPERLAECNFDPAGAGSGVDPCGSL